MGSNCKASNVASDWTTGTFWNILSAHASVILAVISRSYVFLFSCFKIRVNSVNPTVVMTDMGRMAWSDPAKAQPMLDRIPLGRFLGN